MIICLVIAIILIIGFYIVDCYIKKHGSITFHNSWLDFTISNDDDDEV